MRRTRRPVRTLLVASLAAALMTATAPPASASDLAEGFGDITLTGWQKLNLSTPVGTTGGWFQGASGIFPAHSGAPESYIAANYHNVAGANTISNWLITPMKSTLTTTDTLSFWTRTAGDGAFPDRLEVRVSTNGSCNPGATNASVGDFSTLLTSVNPTLAPVGYPSSWTEVTTALTGISGTATGCLAFRYFVTDSGPSGTNGDYIGIDTMTYTDLPLDTTAPTVLIGSGPTGNTADATPTFGFSANEAATFSCRVYAQGTTPPAFAPCSGPGDTHTPGGNLSDGPYTFEVQGTDPSLNAGSATRNFTVTKNACAQAQASLVTHQAALADAHAAAATANTAQGTAGVTLSKATAKLKVAKARLKKAKESGTAAQVTKAKAKVKKAKAALKKAKAAVEAANAAAVAAQAAVAAAQGAVDADRGVLIAGNCV
jgi:hypothetical protein